MTGLDLGPVLRYRILVRLLSPLLLVHLAARASRDGGRRYLLERLGLGLGDGGSGSGDGTNPVGSHAESRLWVHAASVGEVMTVLPLVRGALAKDPARSIVVTTNTPTGAAVLARHAPHGVRHRYLPLDLPGATRRFLARERPAAGWIVETEVWPWLYARCRQHGVPLAIVNARLSPRTAKQADGPLASTYRRALGGVRVLARSTEDAAGYRALGADDALVRTVGELKLAADRAPPPPALLGCPYVLAASTHDDEEVRIARAWLDGEADGLLVIAPRHPERGASLARQLPDCARRALGETPPADARLFLADTLGELDAWYAHARGAFVGGSLIERGGHNVLEPARRGCPIVVGPHTANFTGPVTMLRAAGAITEVDGATDAVSFLSRALALDERTARQGRLAREATRSAGRDMVSAYLGALDGGSSGRP